MKAYYYLRNFVQRYITRDVSNSDASSVATDEGNRPAQFVVYAPIIIERELSSSGSKSTYTQPTNVTIIEPPKSLKIDRKLSYPLDTVRPQSEEIPWTKKGGRMIGPYRLADTCVAGIHFRF